MEYKYVAVVAVVFPEIIFQVLCLFFCTSVCVCVFLVLAKGTFNIVRNNKLE